APRGAEIGDLDGAPARGGPADDRASVHRREGLAEDGLIHPPRHRAAVLDHTDERAPAGHPREERLGAVDRVQEPRSAGVLRAGGASLLPDHAITGAEA